MIIGNSEDPAEGAARFKLHDLRCFEAVVRLGSFQAAATALNRSHPSVFAAVARLEQQTGLVLLDRSGYRVEPTPVGRMLHARALAALHEIDHLWRYARHLASGEEPALCVVLGDLCPRPVVLGLLSAFFGNRPRTRLDLDYEAVSGPFERLRAGSADLAFHRVDPSVGDFEQVALCEIRMIPVAAPGFLPPDIASDATPDRLRPYTQCVIRDTAPEAGAENHFLIEGAPRCSVPDHTIKRELIAHGLAWGHLPDFMIRDDLQAGRLIDLTGARLKGRIETFAALRHAGRPVGPVAQALWAWLSSVQVADVFLPLKPVG